MHDLEHQMVVTGAAIGVARRSRRTGYVPILAERRRRALGQRPETPAMKARNHVPRGVAIALYLGLSSVVAAPASGASDLLLKGARVITMRDGPTAVRADIVTRDDRILLISADAVSADAADTTTIDVTGKYIIPGLTEMHAHVPVDVDYRNDVLFLWAANGVTTARGMMGHPTHLDLRDDLADGALTGPRLITSGPSFSGGSVRAVDAARARVHAQKNAGYDLLKIHPGLTAKQFRAVAEEARVAGIRFAGHVTGAIGLQESLRAGQQTIDHLDGYVRALVPANQPSVGMFGSGMFMHADMSRLAALIELTLETGAAVVPTETLLENLASSIETLTNRPEFAYLPRSLRQNYIGAVQNSAAPPEQSRAFLALRKRLIKELFDAGVPVLLGSDSPQIFNVPGFSIHRELAAMVAAGLTPYQALQTGTSIPAAFLEQEDEWGSLAVGLAADAVVLDADPLTDISNTNRIHGVLIRGRWLTREDRSARLAAIKRKHE